MKEFNCPWDMQIASEQNDNNHAAKLVLECFLKLGRKFPESEDTNEALAFKQMNPEQVNLCLDTVSDVLVEQGLKEDDEPNAFGLELYKAMAFLTNLGT